MGDIVSLDLTVGQRYWLRYRSATQRLDRTAVMTYLGTNGDALTFNARPVAGTQEMPRSWLLDIVPVAAGTAVHLNRVVRP